MKNPYLDAVTQTSPHSLSSASSQFSLSLSVYISASLSISHLPPPLATTHQQRLLQLDGNVLQALLSLLSSVMAVI